jgi:hypothetical protein
MARRKAYVLSEDEHLWGGFLIDLNAQDAVSLFKKARITSYAHDRETVHESWNEFRTIVTCDEGDFIRYILEHQKRDSGKRCQDCWGLVIVPSEEIVRRRVIEKHRKGIVLDGSPLPWSVVAYANLCVSLHADGSIGVRKFRRCEFCNRNSPIEATWYKKLPEIGTRKGGKAKK